MSCNYAAKVFYSVQKLTAPYAMPFLCTHQLHEYEYPMPVKATFLRMPRNPRIPWRQKQRISSKNNTTARHCASVRHQANAASVPRVCLNLKFEDRTHTCYCQFSCASQSELIRTIIHISVNVCVCVCWIIRYLNEVINRVRVSRERERVKFYSF